MARYEIVIETHRREAGYFSAQVVKGPAWALRSFYGGADGPTADAACASVVRLMREHYPKHTFDFLHVES